MLVQMIEEYNNCDHEGQLILENRYSNIFKLLIEQGMKIISLGNDKLKIKYMDQSYVLTSNDPGYITIMQPEKLYIDHISIYSDKDLVSPLNLYIRLEWTILGLQDKLDGEDRTERDIAFLWRQSYMTEKERREV